MIGMVTIEETKKLGQQSAKEHMEEGRRNYPYMGYVLRKISPYFTKFLIDHNVTANQVSALSIVTGIAANTTFVFGNYYLMLLGCFLYQLWNIFDLVDGEIARVTDVKTAGGKYLETINEPITECGFILCLGIGLSKILNDKTLVFWGLFFALCYALLHIFARTRDMMIERFQIQEEIAKPEKIQRPSLKSHVKKLYKKARLFFVLFNGYLVLTLLTIFQLFLVNNAYLVIFGLKLNVLSTYFFIYGLIWMVKVVVTAVTNYTYLTKLEA
jgi:phosphatidylglycerophosphate synthase